MSHLQRPYPLRTAGIPLSLSYDSEKSNFRFVHVNPVDGIDDRPFDSTIGPPLTGHPTISSRETVIFLPPRFLEAWRRPISYRPFDVSTSDGSWTVDESSQTLIWTHSEEGGGAEHWIEMRITRKEEDGPEVVHVLAFTLVALIMVVLAFHFNSRR